MTPGLRRLLALGLGLALAVTGGALLRRAADRDGVIVTKLSPDGAAARLYRLGDGVPETAVLTEHADGEGGHAHALTLGGPAPAALILTAPGDRAETLATELARRGVSVLTADGGAAGTWDWLTEQDFVRLSSLALIASPGRGAEAAGLLESLAGSGRESAAAVLAGDAALLDTLSASPGRNLLFLTAEEPPRESLEAFLGENERRPGWIGGYFAEGTARKVVRPWSGRWNDPEALGPVIDWLGSSLGHVIELSDEDLLSPGAAVCRRWGTACLVLGGVALAAALPLGRKRKNEDSGRN